MAMKAISLEKHFEAYLQGVGVDRLIRKIIAQELLLKNSNRASNTPNIVSGLRYVCGKELLDDSFASYTRQGVNDRSLGVLFDGWNEIDTRDFINSFSESRSVGSEMLIACLFHDYLVGRYDADTDETMFSEYSIRFSSSDMNAFKRDVTLFYTQFFSEEVEIIDAVLEVGRRYFDKRSGRKGTQEGILGIVG